MSLLDQPFDRLAFFGLIGAVAVARMLELAVARRNTVRLLAAGGREVGRGHYPVMVALHTAVLALSPLEVWLLDRPWLPWLGAASIATILAATGMRLWVMRTLGARWTTRVIVPAHGGRITSGPYRFLRHPNYLAVALEVPAIPLVHTAWLTAAVFGLANLALLAVRIRVEDRALEGPMAAAARD